ncbi:hypothetical protein Tco_1270107 [Tanacetum coccineum]
MTTLAEFMIIVGANNHPPMLEKSLYDSWKIRMELYIENWENRRMILNSLQSGTLVWPTVVEEDGTTRIKKYEELSVAEKLQADYDLKATNIILQGLPPNMYAIVNHHKVSKEIWDRVKLLMQCTKLSLQEKEYKLYDEFDKFLFVKGETLVTVQQVQGRQGKSYAGNSYKGNATSLGEIMQEGRQGWLNVIIVKEAVKILDEEQLAFVADPGIPDGKAAQTTIPNTAAF